MSMANGESKLLPMTGWTRGIIGREVRAARPALTALALLFLGGPWISVTLNSALSKGIARMPEAQDMAQWWTIVAMFAALIAGVLCGAEEEENRTAEFTRCLPLSPLRILLEKIAGSLVGLGIWAIVTLAGMALLNPLLAKADGIGFLASFAEKGFVLRQASWAIVFYFCALACGAWIGRVLPSVLAAGVLGVAILYPALYYLTNLGLLDGQPVQAMAPLLIAVAGASALALCATALRYQMRAGLMAFGTRRDKSKGAGIAWKDWRKRRYALWGMGLLIAASPVAPQLTLIPGLPSDIGAIICIGASLILASYVLGILLMENEEYRPVDGLIYALPIERQRIWREKTTVLLRQWAVLAGVALLATIYWHLVVHWSDYTVRPLSENIKFLSRNIEAWRDAIIEAAFFAVLATGSIAALFFGACLSLHIRSKIVLLAAGAALLAPIALMAAFQFMVPMGFANDTGGAFIWHIAAAMARMLIVAAALALWLRFLIVRGMLPEMPESLRSVYAALFAIVLAVAYLAFLMCNYRDLAFLLFGV